MRGCALAASAGVLVTGDKDLLSLHPFRGIAIVAPAAFLAMQGEFHSDH
jgi:predicted nucleic acid-binding protein